MSVADKVYTESQLNEFSLTALDNLFKENDAFVKDNIALSGEPQVKIAKTNRDNLRNYRAEKFAEVRDRMADDSTSMDKLGAIGRGFNENLAGFLGTPYDISQSIMNTVTGSDYEGYFGSKNLKRNLQALGMGYYDSQPSRLLKDANQDPATLGDMPPSTRPFAVTGEALGATTLMTTPISVAARGRQIAEISKTPSMYSGTAKMAFDDLVDKAVTNPRMYHTLEAGIGTMSAIGEGAAESVSPGDPNARMIGAFSPLAITSLPLLAQASLQSLNFLTRGTLENFGKKISHVVATKMQGEEGTKKIASDILAKTIKEGGADPLEIAKLIKLDDLPENLSAGQITKSPLLLGIESALIKSSKGELDQTLRIQTEQQMKDVASLYNNVINLKDADPDLVLQIASKRAEMFNFATNSYLKAQENKLLKIYEQSRRFGQPDLVTDPKLKEVIASEATKVKSILNETRKKLADSEKAAWLNVPRDLNANAYETLDAIRKQVSPDELGFELFEQIKLTDVFQKLRQVQNVGEGFDIVKVPTVSSGDLLDLKNILGDQYRALVVSSNQNANKLARAIQEIRVGVYNDLNKIQGIDQNLKLANAATTNEYNFLDIPIVREINKNTLQGNPVKEPDVVLESRLLKSSNGQSQFHSFNDLFRAAAYDDMTAGKITDPLARFYYAAAQSSATATGEINPKTLTDFINRNQDGLKALGVFNKLQDQRNQVVLYKALQKQAKQFVGSQYNGQIGKLLKTEDVLGFTNDILFKGQRAKNLQKAINIVRNKKIQGIDSKKAEEGFQQSIIQNILAAAQKSYTQGQGDNFVSGIILDSKKLDDILNKKINGRTLRQDLLQSKVLYEDQLNALSDLSKKAEEFESLLNIRSGRQSVLSEEQTKLLDKALSEDMMLDTLGRLAGASLASFSVFGGAIGHDLIVAHIGSKLGRNIISKLPNLKIQKMLSKAVQDPSLMKELLERSGRKQEKFNKRKSDITFLAKLQLNDIIDDRERYEIEGRDQNNEKLFSFIQEHLDKGFSPIQVMSEFEKAARNPRVGTTGPYQLDFVQGYLGLSDAQRMKAIRNVTPKINAIRKRQSIR